MLRQAERKIVDYLGKIGDKRVRWLVENKKNFSDFVPPGKLAEYKAKAKNYDWVAFVITDEDFINIIPAWVKSIVSEHGDEGALWLKAQLKWLREIFTGG